jgi:hypothetical protein
MHSGAANPRDVGLWSRLGGTQRWRADLAAAADSGKAVEEELQP